MKILAIETSCDETAIALVEARGKLTRPRFQVIKNIVSSQVKIHRPFGGVVPSLAKREHIKNLPIVLKKVTGGDLEKVNLITVTIGPGLEPALWTGINFAKELGKKNKKPIIGANHLEGHLYSFLLTSARGGSAFGGKNLFPAIVLIVSGGHTILAYQKNLITWKKIGETRDDAAGEAFDKVGRLLKLPYPGGPGVETLARGGNPEAIEFPQPMIHQKNYDFSFSGLKTAVLYHIRDSKLRIHPNLQNKRGRKFVDSHKFADSHRRDIAASFQQAIIDVLVAKTMRAANEYGVHSVILAGGVAANKTLRKSLKSMCRKNGLNFLVAKSEYQTDNGAMIAVAGYISYLTKKRPRLTAKANLSL